MKVFAIFDVKLGRYAPPFIAQTAGQAERDFKGLVQNRESIIAKNPEDFRLFELGEYNDQTGLIENHPNPILTVDAIALTGPKPS